MPPEQLAKRGMLLDIFILLCLALIVLLFRAGLLYLRPGGTRRFLPPQRQRLAPWTGAEVFLAFALTQIVLLLFVYETLVAVDFFPWLQEHGYLPADDGDGTEILSLMKQLWVNSLAMPLQVATIVLLFRGISRTRPYQLGLTTSHFGRNAFIGFITWFLFTPFVYVVLAVANYAYRQILGEKPEVHPLTKLAEAQLHPSQWVLLIFAAVVAAPVSEELVFRGVFQPWCARRRWRCDLGMVLALLLTFVLRRERIVAAWNERSWSEIGDVLSAPLFVLIMVPGYLFLRSWSTPPAFPSWLRPSEQPQHLPAAIYSTSLFFAMMHSFAWPQPIPLFFLAVGLGMAAHRTQSLVAPITTHAMFNAIACIGLLFSR